jgi:hypothetical protein
MFGFWLVVILIGIGNRLVEIFLSKREYAIKDVEVQSPKIQKKYSLWTTLNLKTRIYFTLPVAVRYHCAQPVGWCTVPARIQLLTIAAFIIINVVLCCVNYRIFLGNL